MPVMSVAIGIYRCTWTICSNYAWGVLHLPLEVLISEDGELRDELSEWAVAAAKEVENRGTIWRRIYCR